MQCIRNYLVAQYLLNRLLRRHSCLARWLYFPQGVTANRATFVETTGILKARVFERSVMLSGDDVLRCPLRKDIVYKIRVHRQLLARSGCDSADSKEDGALNRTAPHAFRPHVSLSGIGVSQ